MNGQQMDCVRCSDKAVRRPISKRRPARNPFPEYLAREPIAVPIPERRPCCGSTILSELGVDIIERRSRRLIAPG